MDEKTFECLSKGMLVLVKWAGKKYGVEAVNARVVLVDDAGEKESSDEVRG